jgi:hypothetical protein
VRSCIACSAAPQIAVAVCAFWVPGVMPAPNRSHSGRVTVDGTAALVDRHAVSFHADMGHAPSARVLPRVPLKLKLSVLTLSQRLVTPRTPRVSGARLGVQPLQLPEIPIHYKWGPQ